MATQPPSATLDGYDKQCHRYAVAADADWREKSDFMRDVDATHATWDEQGRLLALTLGPKTSPRREPGTQNLQPLTEEQRREARRRVSLASSSRLVPVLREKP